MSGPVDTAAWEVLEPEIMDTDRYLSSANAPDLEEDVRLCIQSGARNMIINCAALTYLTGAGVRTFLNLSRMMHDVGGTLSIQNLAGQPRDMFAACGMDTLIPLIDPAIAPAASSGRAFQVA